jgi:hypothetical protein
MREWQACVSIGGDKGEKVAHDHEERVVSHMTAALQRLARTA